MKQSILLALLVMETVSTLSYAKGRQPPLHQAVQHNDMLGAERLLKEGAKVDEVDGIGWTPLITACHFRNVHMAELLIRNGADVNFQSMSLPHKTALSIAIRMRDRSLINLLLDHGADVSMKVGQREDLGWSGKTALEQIDDEIAKYTALRKLIQESNKEVEATGDNAAGSLRSTKP